MMSDGLLWHRIQFALTVTFFYLCPNTRGTCCYSPTFLVAVFPIVRGKVNLEEGGHY